MLLNSLTRLLEWKMACMLLKDNRLNNQKAPTKGWETSVIYKTLMKKEVKMISATIIPKQPLFLFEVEGDDVVVLDMLFISDSL